MRVFTIYERACQWREMHRPSAFNILYTIMTAWRGLTRQMICRRTKASQLSRALCFRGASLLAKHFYQWIDYFDKRKITKKKNRLRLKRVVKFCFLSWKVLVVERMTMDNIAVSNYRLSVKRLFFHTWRSVLYYLVVLLPTAYHCKIVLIKCFHAWRLLRPLLRLMHVLMPTWPIRRMHER